MEIERKFILMNMKSLSEIPWISQCERHVTDRFYLIVKHVPHSLYTIEREVRLTHWINEPNRPDRISFKSGGDMVREEYETNLIGSEFYQSIANHYAKMGIKPIHKDMYVDPVTKVAFADVDHGQMLYAEIEFNLVEDANDWKWPYSDIEVYEVTDIPSRKMANYWCETRIPE